MAETLAYIVADGLPAVILSYVHVMLFMYSMRLKF